jgi:hypothetical protein
MSRRGFSKRALKALQWDAHMLGYRTIGFFRPPPESAPWGSFDGRQGEVMWNDLTVDEGLDSAEEVESAVAGLIAVEEGV